MTEPITVYAKYDPATGTESFTVKSWPEEAEVDMAVIQQTNGSISITGEVRVCFDNADAIYEIVGVGGNSLKLRLVDGRIYG